MGLVALLFKRHDPMPARAADHVAEMKTFATSSKPMLNRRVDADYAIVDCRERHK